MRNICSSNQCKSCGMCVDICPKKAISLITNEYGENKVEIDQDKCVDCKLCQIKCPENNKLNNNQEKKCYVCAVKDNIMYSNSSSGGIGSEISKHYLDQGGIVYGSAIHDGHVNHIRIDTIDELHLLAGSKYVRSSMDGVYRKIKKDLLDGKKVLFVGTPCQVAAVQCFCDNRDNLLTIDLICHGTPPEKQFINHLEENNINFSKNNTYKFRNKNMHLNVYNSKKLIYSKRWWDDYYYSAFMYGLNYYENCYSCQYACDKRIADITIGDFWGIERSTLPNDLKQVEYLSLVMLNSKKGIEIFENIKENIFLQERLLDEAKKGNSQLNRPATRHRDRDSFLNNYPAKGFDSAVKSTSISVLMKKKYIRFILGRIYHFFFH